MKITSDRFGTLELDETDVINFPSGIIGFPDERTFVLLRRHEGSAVGWLQSTKTSGFALPVVSLDELNVDHAAFPVEQLAKAGGVSSDETEYAVMVVLNTSNIGIPATVNLLAPIVVNSVSRQGAQILLENTKHSTHEPFRLRRILTDTAPDPSKIDISETKPSP